MDSVKARIVKEWFLEQGEYCAVDAGDIEELLAALEKAEEPKRRTNAITGIPTPDMERCTWRKVRGRAYEYVR